MIRFTVRIELHDANREHYTKLNEKMFQQGFTNIATEKGTEQAPPAEYNYDGIVTKKQVLQKARTIAASIVNKYAVLVTNSNGRTWYG
jgi:dTDP-glucose pyrophosphorylase